MAMSKQERRERYRQMWEAFQEKGSLAPVMRLVREQGWSYSRTQAYGWVKHYDRLLKGKGVDDAC